MNIKKVISLFLAMFMMFSVLPIGAVTVSASGGVKAKLDIVVSRYPSGSRWTDSFDGGIQCYGFAKMVIYNVFGKSSGSYRHWRYDGTPTVGMTVVGSITSFSSNNVKSLLSKAKPGDVLQFNTTKQHSMIVYSVLSDGVNIYDCNWDNNCGVSKRKCSFGAWNGRNSSKLTLLRASNYSNVDGISHVVNTNYPKNFTAYPKSKISASNIFDANHNQYSSTAWIGTSDKCTIHEVYTDGCCKVTYPISSGTVTAYSKISLFNTHTHNYTGARLYEPEHPHAISQRCTDYSSCGGYYWTGEYKKVNTCEKCWNIDWNCSVSSLKLKAGESKNITISIDPNTACVPEGGKVKFDYNKSLVELKNSGTSFTFKALRAGSCNFVVTAYSDSTLNKVISTFKLPISVDTQTYTVSYNANGGIGAPASQTKVYNEVLQLSKDKPSREGYIFAGWSVNNPANGNQYSPGDNYKAEKSITLYAYWKPIEYFIQCFANDGSNEKSGEMMLRYGEEKTLSTNQFSRYGYTFVNWNTEPDGTGKSYSNGQVVKNLTNTQYEVVKLYAQWKPITYTVTYNANGGTGAPANQIKKFNEVLRLSSIQPQRTGYQFLGWSVSSTSSSANFSSGDYYSNDESITLYAVWSKEHIHSFSIKVTPATCSKTGIKVTSCDGCGLVSKTEVIEKTNHKPVIDEAVTSTCTTGGLTQGSHCAICGVVLVEQKELLAEHKWNEGIITKRATCISNGKKSVTCLSCGETKEIIILANGHNYTERVVEPTCTSKGYTEYNCSACGDSFLDNYVFDTGHTYKNTVTKASTKKNGAIVTKCSECGYISNTTTIYYPKTISLSTTSYTYNGKVKTPGVIVKDSRGKTLKKNTDYTVTYAKGRKSVGKYTVTIKFKGNYSGTVKKTFTIKPKSTSISNLTPGKKKFTVKWKKQSSQTTGYQIQYSTSSKFKRAKTVTVSKNKTTAKTISKLKAKKKYYVRVRTYKSVNGTKIYSSWSKAKYVTTKK